MSKGKGKSKITGRGTHNGKSVTTSHINKTLGGDKGPVERTQGKQKTAFVQGKRI